MNTDKIQSLLTQSVQGINNTVKFLTSLQKKEITPISSGLPHLDLIGLGGMFPDTTIGIVARPGNGKSYTGNSIRTSILKNPDDNLGVLLYNLEMPFFTLLMVELKKVLHKSLKDIISKPPAESEIPLYKQVADEFRDDRLTKIDETMSPEDFYKVTKAYIEANRHRKQLFVIIDHIGIIKGVNKTESIHQTMEYINILKMEYPGLLTFIVLGQLNREIEHRWRNKETNPMTLFPDSSSVFGSDSILFFCDIVMAQVIPQVMGMERYGVINRERNKHLEDHILDEDKDGIKEYVRLKGNNRIYYHFLKVRLLDGEPTVYAAILDPEQEEFDQATKQYEKDYTEPEDEVIF